MRLYLSSWRLGDRAGSLLALLGNGKRAAVIENALDAEAMAARDLFKAEVYDPAAELAGIGIDSTRLDLRSYFGRPDKLRRDLQGFDLVWVTGGNAFVLRRAMKQSGFDDVITDMLERDEIVYGGCSAGAVVAAPGLAGIQLIDNPDQVPTGYDPDAVWDGLGLIDHAIVPHYRSAHPDSGAAERAVRHLAGSGLRYRALRDGEVIVWTENRRRRAVEPLRRSA